MSRSRSRWPAASSRSMSAWRRPCSCSRSRGEERSRMPEPTLYLFDGYNILHAGGFRGPSDLVDRLADFVALKGARGVVVFDGGGEDRVVGRLEVRHAGDADALLERLAAEHRRTERVCLISSDSTLRGTAGREVEQRSSAGFLADFER